MEKRVITAFVLAMLILLAYYKFFPPQRQAASPAAAPAAAAIPVLPAQPEEQKPSLPEEADTSEETETTIETEKYTLVFSSRGASIKEWRLKGTGDGGEEILLKSDQPSERIFSITSDILPGVESRNYKAEQGPNNLKYTFVKSGTASVTKNYTFHKSTDYIGLDVLIQNLSQGELKISYKMVGPSFMEDIGRIKGRSFVEVNAKIGAKVVKKSNIRKVWTEQGDVSWLGMKTRYFTVLLKPFANLLSVFVEPGRDNKPRTVVETREYVLGPGDSVKDEYFVYAGPIDENKLASFGYGLEEIVDYGWFGAITKILLVMLRFFYKISRNWGFAILLLTLAINVISFPLTKKSFLSMQKLKDVQPHMQKLRELHKDNPQKLNKEMMELYRKYNVNPFGGCLPMLLQLPIFVALYNGLIRAVELKGANFLWIKDLSRPEDIPLPVSLPLIGNHINILPLIMVALMFVQQKLTQPSSGMSGEQESQQKMMAIIMPAFLGVLFYSMPSGLVLYWLTSTSLMIVEQFALLKGQK